MTHLAIFATLLMITPAVVGEPLDIRGTGGAEVILVDKHTKFARCRKTPQRSECVERPEPRERTDAPVANAPSGPVAVRAAPPVAPPLPVGGTAGTGNAAALLPDEPSAVERTESEQCLTFEGRC